MAKRNHVPLVDHNVLHDLEDFFQDPSPARAFARDFVRAWGERYLRLRDAISAEDQPAALDAALSVKISAVMVGAPRLAESATELERTIRIGDMRSCGEALEAIRTCGNKTMNELVATYINQS